MKIGITTIFPGNINYGGMLQAYALPYAIKQIGGDKICVEQINFEYTGNPLYPNLLSRCKQYSLRQIVAKVKEMRISKKTYLISDKLKKRISLFENFRSKYIPQSTLYKVNEHEKIGKDYDVLITGSDQVWNPNVVRDVFMFDFPTGARKIAYAASIARASLCSEEKKYMLPRIGKFDFIGVRELSAKNILVSEGIDSNVVLDPTMLLTQGEWNEVVSPRLISEKYVLLYSFSDCCLKKQIGEYYASKNIKVAQIPYVKMCFNPYDGKSTFEKMWDVGPSEFLSLVKYAEHVYTDSFHGTVFSILFHKQFTVFERAHKAGKVSMNSRITDLLKTFGLSDRLSNDALLTSQNIDYNQVEPILCKLRKESKDWLVNSINS